MARFSSRFGTVHGAQPSDTFSGNPAQKVSPMSCSPEKCGHGLERAPSARRDGVRVEVLPLYSRYSGNSPRCHGVSSCMKSPTAVEDSTPCGQITCGREPAAPYRLISSARILSVRKPIHLMHGCPGSDVTTWPLIA